MTIELKPTGEKHEYKGDACTVFSLSGLSEPLDLLLAETRQHATKLGKKDIVLLDINDVSSDLPFGVAMCDKVERDYFVLIVNPKLVGLFYLAHELVHLLPQFYHIDTWRILRYDNTPIEHWPVFAKCVRKIEHFLSDIHIDAEVIRRGFTVEDHFLQQLNFALDKNVLAIGEGFFDLPVCAEVATNYLQCVYQLHNALKYGLVTSPFAELLLKIQETIALKWPLTYSLGAMINATIEHEEYLEQFTQAKFERVNITAAYLLDALGARSL